SKTLVLKDFFLYIFFIKKCKFIGSSNKSNDKIDKKLNHLSLQSIFHFRLSLLKKWFKKIQLFQTGFHNVETL
ncbi:TPA: hypothetical protein ACGOXY_002169, partial [Streptococcus suis]